MSIGSVSGGSYNFGVSAYQAVRSIGLPSAASGTSQAGMLGDTLSLHHHEAYAAGGQLPIMDQAGDGGAKMPMTVSRAS